MSGQVDIVSVQINEDTGAFEINLKAYRGKREENKQEILDGNDQKNWSAW